MKKRVMNGTIRKIRQQIRTRKGLVFALPWMLLIGSVLILPAAAGAVNSENKLAGNVYAAEEADEIAKGLPSGITGVMNSVALRTSPGTRVNRIGTSFENVMVGQRVTTVGESTAEINVRISMENRVSAFSETAMNLAETPRMMSDTDYETLLRIVESEAGEDDIKGRVLVANVIMNRMKRDDFPDTVTEVVWQRVNGVTQFSPTANGTIWTCTVTDETREAVRQALNGVDYSEGALFFIQKDASEKAAVEWFETDLKRLFKYGVHEFYTYPEEV